MSRSLTKEAKSIFDRLPSVDHAVDQARELTDSARYQAHEMADTARREAQAIGRQTRRYIREEPLKSTLMAIALGALISGLFVLAATRDR
jgi:ElaB/YqjD/DUF883 family membrane-anchored ribosome-binding protein